MNSVKNLRVNEKAFNTGKRFLLIKVGTAILLAAALAIGGIFLGKRIKENYETEQIQTIVEYYGEDSEEQLIVEYIGLSDQLNALDLDKISADSQLYQKYNVSEEIMQPTEIKALIEEYKGLDSSISIKDANGLDNAINTILKIKKQEQLINKYIYTIGYSTANQNITTATKQYAAEVFGIDNYNDIEFKRNSSTDELTMKVGDVLNEKRYHFNGLTSKKLQKEIKDGVSSMINTNTEYDYNNNDNDSYNLDRNIFIKNALEKSVELTNEVVDKNLYSEKLAGKLK